MGRNNGDFTWGAHAARNHDSGITPTPMAPRGGLGKLALDPHEEYLTTGTKEQRAQSKRLLDHDIAQGGGHQRTWMHIPKRSPKKPTTPYKPK